MLVIDLSSQRALLYRNGVPIAASTVSTGRRGRETPRGVFTILQKKVIHRSRTYDDAPMPYMLVSGRIIDRYTRRSRSAYALAPAISLAVAMPFYVLFVWAPTWPLALVFLTVSMFLNYFYLSSSVALVQEEVRPNQRVLSGALLLLVMGALAVISNRSPWWS